MAQVAWALVHGIATLAIDGLFPRSPVQTLDDFLQFSSVMLIEGLLNH